MKQYEYMGYIIVKDGTKEIPYNICKEYTSKLNGEILMEYVGMGKTIKECKATIDYMKEEV